MAKSKRDPIPESFKSVESLDKREDNRISIIG